MNDSTRVRVSIIGVVCLALFAALVARLWFIQLVSGETFAEAAEANSTRVVQTEAPRGRLRDVNGEVLVQNKRTTAVTVDRDLSDEDRDLVLGRLSELLAQAGVTGADDQPLTTDELRDRAEDPRGSAFEPAVVATDVPDAVAVAIAEHREDFAGVEVEELPVREYLYPESAAHLLGYVGEISEDQLADVEDEGYQLGDTIGKSGAELAYESDLRGEPRRDVVEVDPANRVVGDEPIESTPAVPGDDVFLTLDFGVQQAAETALADAIAQARDRTDPNTDEKYAAPAGSVVVLDVTDGSVVAMASSPTYPAWAFTGGIPQDLWDQLTAEDGPFGAYPLTNRVTQGQYAPGSTFKPVTALAALAEGLRTPDTPWDDPGSITIGGQRYDNSEQRRHGRVNLVSALARSVDTYFYEIGRLLWQSYDAGDVQRGDAIQREARALGFGKPTGIPLAESAGRVPDAAFKDDFAQNLYSEPDQEDDLAIHRRWLPGDNVNLSIGQGFMLATPLQLADAYAALANGGTLYVPRVADRIVSADGRDERDAPAEVAATVDLDPTARLAIMAGLQQAVDDPEGTAHAAFAGFPTSLIPVAGKTGTAQVAGKSDTSLFAAVAPANQPKYAVVAVVEEAGFGADVAAPVVRKVLEELFHVDAGAGLSLESTSVGD